MILEKIKKELVKYQKNEITENIVYSKLAESIKNPKNKRIINHIANDELDHYNLLKKYTGLNPKPNRINILKYYLISKIFGLTFGLKLMEKGEENSKINYNKLLAYIPDAKKMLRDENEHEKKLINLLNEEKLKYVGSIVLGLNDALVELTGALAGLTLALQHSKLIAIAGLITGIAASLSMGASEYLSIKSEKDKNKNALKASIYTWIAYILTVVFLIFPYLIINNLYASLAWALINAIIIIFIFTFYMSVSKDEPFLKNFFEMVLISLGIAAVSFVIGFVIRIIFGIEI
jgi:VIT1/CCC1 family predicted Fe2+/Mn2+ transporter